MACKSTLCTLLATNYNLDQCSIGNELRNLVSKNSTGHAARIKCMLSVDELVILAQNVKAGTLAPSTNTPKYIIERVFPEGAILNHVRILLDGFPRKVDRWEAFKEGVQELWRPDDMTWVIVMDVDRNLARQRFMSRGRAGDEFERRFDEHMENIGPIVAAMKNDGVNVIEYKSAPDYDAGAILKFFSGIPGWTERVGKGSRE
ncbi:uridylate kinase [Pyrenophora seminiperda CCB06]|uniref:Uridylate kinase n=1 Tax=Pyrenophora seminiperda CCB06 TaxID=1302712 RepID=A0A3M7MI62_9PLEO|nr:uridylate kinase [Pyrenophora seminiperda CCB06]